MQTIDFKIGKAYKKHSGKNFAIRLNGTSDIPYEKIKVREGKNIFELYSDVQFYDYTKIPNRFEKELPRNYHLTFSRSESNHEVAMKLLRRGVNVAMVFDVVPNEYEGVRVVSGDDTDLRFLDDRGVIVGLKYKNQTGKGADNKSAFTSGFAISLK
jgi:hypothetical protein